MPIASPGLCSISVANTFSINTTYRRSGTLCEGRHKGSLINVEGYLLSCYRYIELNPVTACMVGKPEEYP
jgi:putative transposase